MSEIFADVPIGGKFRRALDDLDNPGIPRQIYTKTSEHVAEWVTGDGFIYTIPDIHFDTTVEIISATAEGSPDSQ